MKYARSALHELSHSTTMTWFMHLDRTYLPSQSNPLKTYSEAPWLPGCMGATTVHPN